jgi:hypothetical protein
VNEQPAAESLEPKRKRGGQPGNMNGFNSRVTLLKRAASRGKLRGRQKRIRVEVTARLIDDLGGMQNISEAQRIVVGIIARQFGRLDRKHRCYDTIRQCVSADRPHRHAARSETVGHQELHQSRHGDLGTQDQLDL